MAKDLGIVMCKVIIYPIETYSFKFSQNCSQNSVSFGSSSCKTIECTSQWIRCETSYANNVYQINNNGYDPCNSPFYSKILK